MSGWLGVSLLGLALIAAVMIGTTILNIRAHMRGDAAPQKGHHE